MSMLALALLAPPAALALLLAAAGLESWALGPGPDRMRDLPVATRRRAATGRSPIEREGHAARGKVTGADTADRRTHGGWS
jgi:hypothetical protein